MGQSLGKILIAMGVVLVVAGGLVMLLGRFTRLGHLPGDIRIERRGVSFYFPLASMIIVSLVLTVLLNVIFRLIRK